jgi:phosphosulfolactate phosphohydrolase-like enzyme
MLAEGVQRDFDICEQKNVADIVPQYDLEAGGH